MSASDVVQAASLLAVVVTLIVSMRQNREMVRQTQEAARQSMTTAASLRRESILGMVNHVTDFTYSAMSRDSALLAWFLGARGFPADATEREQHRYFFLWTRLFLHQSHHVERLEGLIPDDIWEYWLNVIRFDVGSAGFDVVWATVGHTYIPTFRAFIEQLIENPRPAPTPRAPAPQVS
jgi:hypothetical protein